MILYTVDEARAAIVESSAFVLHRIHADPVTLELLLRGERRGAAGCLRSADRALATAHRSLLNELMRIGYGWVIEGELDGICSAVFKDDGTCDPIPILQVVGLRYLDEAAA